jgi:hypothetical protein
VLNTLPHAYQQIQPTGIMAFNPSGLRCVHAISLQREGLRGLAIEYSHRWRIKCCFVSPIIPSLGPKDSRVPFLYQLTGPLFS